MARTRLKAVIDFDYDCLYVGEDAARDCAQEELESLLGERYKVHGVAVSTKGFDEIERLAAATERLANALEKQTLQRKEG